MDRSWLGSRRRHRLHAVHRCETDVEDEYMGEDENHLKHDEEFLSRSERDIQGTRRCCLMRGPVVHWLGRWTCDLPI